MTCANKTTLDMVKKKLLNVGKSINSKFDITDKSNPSIIINFTDVKVEGQENLFCRSNGWNISLHNENQVMKIEKEIINPLSSIVLSCYVINEIYKRMIPEFENYIDDEIRFNLVDYSKKYILDELPQKLHLGEFHLFGVGAIGSSFIYGISKLNDITGLVHLVDFDDVDESNLQRYIFSDLSNVKQKKIDVAEKLLNAKEIEVKKYPVTFGEYYNSLADKKLEYVICALDTKKGRVQTQALLPRVIYNASTGDYGQISVSRNTFGTNEPCLACLYTETMKGTSKAEEIAEIFGIKPARAHYLYYNDIVLTMELSCEIVNSGKVRSNYLEKFIGKRFTEIFPDAYCGQINRDISIEKSFDKHVPYSHQSVLAGTLTLIEFIKSKIYDKDESFIEYQIYLIGKTFPEYYSCNGIKLKSCICTDKDYIEVYSNKFE